MSNFWERSILRPPASLVFRLTCVHVSVFIARQHANAPRARYYRWQIRPSVCLYVTLWYCI